MCDPYSRLSDAEYQTGSRVTITFDESEAQGKFYGQEQSPLFSLLPRELRDLVWAYVLAPFEDQTRPFAATAYFYRPGHTAHLKTDTNILRTCRRVWLEANHLAMLQAEHSYYFHRAAPDARNPEWTAALTEHNRLNFGHLHMYVQMFAIEGLSAEPQSLRRMFLETPARPGDFQPRVFHVTIRHTDWWFWENEQPLKLADRWVQAMLDSPDLRSTQTFKLELETLDYKINQLRPILDRLKNLESREYETHYVDGKPSQTKFVLNERDEQYRWEGPANIDNDTYGPYAGMQSLKYTVTILTWSLKFPQYPTAFIPTMRRQPRIKALPKYPHYQPDDTISDGVSTMALPYADEASHRGARLSWRRKWRQERRKQDQDPFLSPAEADWKYFMGGVRHKAIRFITQKQAGDVELHRWRLFGKQTVGIRARKLEKEGSLLRLVEVESTEQSC